MQCVIRILANAAGYPCPEADHYVMNMDCEAHDGRGHLLATKSLDAARKFATSGEALTYYQRTSRTRPVRPDGRPNRPLTAYTIEILPVERKAEPAL